MTYSRVVLAAIAGFWLVTAQRSVAQQDEPVQSYTIHIKGDDSKPIEGVKVWVTRDYPQFPAVTPDTPRGSARGTTDTNGDSTIRLPGNSFNLMATLDGYAPLFLRGLAADSRKVIEGRLSRGQTISGQVMTADHKPINNATVIARRENFAMNYMDEFAPKATTSVDGRFSIEHAVEAAYVLSVQSPVASGQWSFDPLVLQVQPNSQPASIEMIAKAGVVVEGKIIGPVGVAVGNRRITVLIRLPAEIRWETTTNPDGSFTLTNIPAGCIGAIAFPTIRDYATVTSTTQPLRGLNPKINSIDLRMPEAGTYRGVEARFTKMVDIHGQVIDPSGAPLAGAMVIAEPTNRVFTSDADGHFTAQLPPGIDARLRIGSSNTMNASSGPTFKVSEGKNEDQTLMAVRKVELPHADEITGKVVDGNGQPIPDAKVFISNDSMLPRSIVMPNRNGAGDKPTWTGGMTQPAQTTTDASGVFRFDKLDPGKTDIWAFQGRMGWGFKERILSTARDVVIQLSPQDEKISIDGTVLDVEGKPAPDVAVYVAQGVNISREIFAKTSTDAAGKFSASFVMPVEYNQPYLWLVCSSKSGLLWRSLPQSSVHDLHFQFKPASHLTGRVVDGEGQPVKQARVSPSQLEDPDFGLFVFSRIAQAAPFAESRDDGSFELDGLPQGATVYFRARHDKYGAGELMAVQNLSDKRTLDDIKMTDEIVIEGVVRQAGTQQPVVGASVLLTGYSERSDAGRDMDWHLNKAVSDASGHYRMGGLDSRNFIDNSANLKVKLGEGDPAEMEGSLRFSKRLFAGDHVTLNVNVDRPLALREQEWRRQTGKLAASHALIAVADDADPAFKDKSAYADTLTVYDTVGAVRGQANGLNFFSSSGPHLIAASPHDGSIWLIESSGQRLLHYSREAKLLSEQKDTPYGCLAIDPKSGNIWTLAGGGRIGTSTIHVLNPDGAEIASYLAAGGDLAYSAHDDCFWVAGSQLSKVDRNGKVIAQGAIKVTYAASSLAVNDSDGSVWLTERSHPQIETSVDRLTIFESDGRVRKQVDGFDGAVVVDPSHGAGWAFSRLTSNPRLVKFDLNGNILQTIPLTGSSLAIEPDTGYLWVGGLSAIDRLDLEGNVVATIKSEKKTAKWIAVIPWQER